MLRFNDIEQSYLRSSQYLKTTPLLESKELNEMTGHKFYFKHEGLQITGSFKARGALNFILKAIEDKIDLKQIVAFSSGNHSQAVAWACSKFKLSANIFLPEMTSPFKIQKTKSWGPQITICPTRDDAEKKCFDLQSQGATLIPPFGHEWIIAGQGTCCYEALKIQKLRPDSVFVPVGGGGLFSGSFLACKGADSNIKVFGAEPEIANDAFLTLQDPNHKIYRFDKMPKTIADGARTLSISPKTLHYLKKSDGLQLVNESEILDWYKWIYKNLSEVIEPTSALGLAAAVKWAKAQTSPKTILVLLSGGNRGPDFSD